MVLTGPQCLTDPSRTDSPSEVRVRLSTLLYGHYCKPLLVPDNIIITYAKIKLKAGGKQQVDNTEARQPKSKTSKAGIYNLNVRVKA